MKKALKATTQIFTGAAAAITLTCGKFMSVAVHATGENPTPVEQGAAVARVDGMPADLVGNQGFINRLTSWILLAVGTISVIMLIYGGFRYVVSGGDAKKVTDAKNTILYAIIGLIISMLAYAIVRFVIGAVANLGGEA